MKSVVTRRSADSPTLGEAAAKMLEKLCPQMAGHVEAGTIFYLNIQKQTYSRTTPSTQPPEDTRRQLVLFPICLEECVVSKSRRNKDETGPAAGAASSPWESAPSPMSGGKPLVRQGAGAAPGPT